MSDLEESVRLRHTNNNDDTFSYEDDKYNKKRII